MTPRFFRGSILITSKIISYSEFMDMTVFDFERIEALNLYRMDATKRKTKQKQNKETASKISSLHSIDAKEMGFTSEQIEGLMNG